MKDDPAAITARQRREEQCNKEVQAELDRFHYTIQPRLSNGDITFQVNELEVDVVGLGIGPRIVSSVMLIKGEGNALQTIERLRSQRKAFILLSRKYDGAVL